MRSRLSFTALSGSPTTLKSCMRAEPTSTSTSTGYASIPYTDALIVLKSMSDLELVSCQHILVYNYMPEVLARSMASFGQIPCPTNNKRSCYERGQVAAGFLYSHRDSSYSRGIGAFQILPVLRFADVRLDHSDWSGSDRCLRHCDVQRIGSPEGAGRQRLGGHWRSAQAPLRPDSQSRGNRQGLRRPRKGHSRSGHQRAESRHVCRRTRRQGRSGKHAFRRAKESV